MYKRRFVYDLAKLSFSWRLDKLRFVGVMMIREKLENLYDIGSSKRVFQSEWRSEGVPFYRAREIAKLAIDDYIDNELFIDEELYDSYVKKYGKPQPGDIMVTGVGTLGVCYIVKPNDKFYFKDGNILWFKQKAPDRILPEYLVRLFDSNDVREFISKNSSGTTVGTFTIQTAKKLEINLPSLEEQKSIIQKLTKVENIINNRRRELILLDDCIKARFVEMFGDRLVNDRGWISKAIAECMTFHNGKAHEQVIDENGKFVLVTSRAIASDFKDVRKTNSMLFSLRKNDIVMVMSDVPNGQALAKCQIIDQDNKFTLNQRICCFNEYNSTFNNVFLLNLINRHPYFLSFNDGNGQTNLRKDDILKCNLIVPPMELQNKFACYVDQIDKSKFAVQKLLEETQLLFDKLMQEYFG